MFALKTRKETAFSVLLIAIILVNSLSPTPVSANADGNQPINPFTVDSDIANSLSIGELGFAAQDDVAILSEQIAQEAQQKSETEAIEFKVSAEPAIYIPGAPIQISWKVQNIKTADLEQAAIIIHTPEGITSSDPAITYTADGLMSIPLASKKETLELNAAENMEPPIYVTLDLLLNDDLVTYQSIMIDREQFSAEKGKNSKLKSTKGKVEIEVPSAALDETLSFVIREPSPQEQPPVSLTWAPVEIIAVDKQKKKNVKKFKAPVKVTMRYEETQIFDWNENALTIYYYDPELEDWFPLETTVDPETNTLMAYSDHLTVFDFKANHWQSQNLPTVDAFKVSDFTGAGTYGINIWTPPGPGGLQPTLTLNYNSQLIDESSAYSQPSWVGLGWDLDTGAITRNMHGTDTILTDDTFSISTGGISGLLLPISKSGSVTTYNTADQSFVKVQLNESTNEWTAWGKDGTKYIFALAVKTHSSDGCVRANEGKPLDTTWKWALTSVTDTHSNKLTYNYSVETKVTDTSVSCLNQIAVYPQSISYPNSKYSISFVRQDRKDYQTAWTKENQRTLYGTDRLKEILVQHNGATVRGYAMSYVPDTGTTNNIYPRFKWSAGWKTLTLAGVQEFGSDGSALPSVTFTYGDGLHLTDVNNGQGGQVHINYERWTYFDDENDKLRSLMTVFGTMNGTHPECIYSGGAWQYGTAWTYMSGGEFGCETGNPEEHLRIGSQSSGSPAAGTLVRRSIPENVTKPGGRYRLAIDGGSDVGVVDINWGFWEWNSTTYEEITYTNDAPGNFSLDQSFEMSVNFNPSNTYLYLDCTDCKISKYQFALFPQMYRVTSRTVTVKPTSVVSTYTYRYDNAAPNTADNSYIAATYGNDALYTPMLREFRGNAMSQVVNPDGLATVNWFYQSDPLKGRVYDSLTMDQSFFEDFDDHVPSALSAWTPLPANTVPNPKTNKVYFGGPGYDWGLETYSSNTNWVSLARTASSLVSGEMAVAHIAFGEDVAGEKNATAEVGLSNSGQLFGITLTTDPVSNTVTATASNGEVLLGPGSFKRNEWYGVMFFLDTAGGSRIRLWQLDNPANFDETIVSNVGGGDWTFQNRAYDGVFWLDSYFEGIPYAETLTKYKTSVQYDTATDNQIPDLLSNTTVDLSSFRDLRIVWNTVESVEQRNYNGDAKYAATKQVLTYDTSANYGNMLTELSCAEVDGNWTAYRANKYEYHPNATSSIYLVSLPARQRTLAMSESCDAPVEGDTFAETLSFYDNHQYNNASLPTVGELKMQRTWVQGSDYRQISFSYYPNGNAKEQVAYRDYVTAVQASDPGGAQTTTTAYDTAGYSTYPVSVTNALGQVTQTTFDYAMGLPISVTAPNGSVTSATYDVFGRMKTVTASGDTTPTLAVDYLNYNATNNTPFQINLKQTVSANASIRLSRFYDGAGRQIQSQTVGAVVNGALQNTVVDFQYDINGRLIKQSVPRSTIYTTTPSFVSQNFGQSTVTTYDVLGRTKTALSPNQNEIQYDYSTDLQVNVRDAKGYTTSSLTDIWGRTVLVDASEGPDVSYGYDILNRLKTATRGGLTTEINYDAAGRKLNMDDPDMGFWEYEYDALGNLIHQTDARLCTTTLGYDELNRLSSKSSTGNCGQHVNSQYYYDSDDPATSAYDPLYANQIGHRTHMRDASGSTSWVYDIRGRLFTESKIIGEQVFTTGWNYNSADLPVTMTYPDNEVLTYGYNTDGSLNTVWSNLGITYLGGMKYDEAGRTVSMDYGAGVIRKSFAYFPWNTSTQGGALNTSIVTRLSDQAEIQNLAYTYDANANVSTITDALAGPQTQTFGYDTINRLTSAAVTGGSDGLYSESYTYDPSTGNLASKASLTYTYAPDHPHAVLSLSNGNNYQYDDNGNMDQRIVNGFTFDLAYDAENHLVSVDSEFVPVPTFTPTVGAQLTGTATFTPTNTNTFTPTNTATITSTPTKTFTPTRTPTRTLTPSRTLTASKTPTASRTPTASKTPTASGTSTSTATGSPTYTLEPSATATETFTPDPNASETPTTDPAWTATETETQVPVDTDTPVVTETVAITDTPVETETPSLTPEITNTPGETETPPLTPTNSETPTDTASPTWTTSPLPTLPTPPPSVHAKFVYDGDGKRVQSETYNVTTVFVGSHYEETGSSVTKYYYAGSQRIAMRTPENLFFLLGDHLGSTSLTTDANGAVESEIRYTAWGETRYSAGTVPTKYQYTGQYSYVADFGLQFYNARWYDPSLGRFIQADTIMPSAGNSQAYDRYAYGLNNPLRNTDPTGHIPCEYYGGYGCTKSSTPAPSNTQVVVFCGSQGGGNLAASGPDCPGGTLYAWSPEINGYPVQPPQNFITWPGGDFGKYVQYRDASARELAKDTSVILMCYSSGSEGCLMYAKERIDNGQQVQAVVLMDPTFYGGNDPYGTKIDYGGGDPNVPFDDWQDYMNYIVQNGGNILVIDDKGDGGIEDNDNHPDSFTSPAGSTGVYHYTYYGIEHNSEFDPHATNLNTDLASWAYKWATNPFGK